MLVKKHREMIIFDAVSVSSSNIYADLLLLNNSHPFLSIYTFSSFPHFHKSPHKPRFFTPLFAACPFSCLHFHSSVEIFLLPPSFFLSSNNDQPVYYAFPTNFPQTPPLSFTWRVPLLLPHLSRLFEKSFNNLHISESKKPF